RHDQPDADRTEGDGDDESHHAQRESTLGEGGMHRYSLVNRSATRIRAHQGLCLSLFGSIPARSSSKPPTNSSVAPTSKVPPTRASEAAAVTLPESGSTRSSRATVAPASPAPTSEDALPRATQRAITIAAIGFAFGSCRTAARTRR